MIQKMLNKGYPAILLEVILFILPTMVLSQNANNFGFYGYMRSGFGTAGMGKPLDVFQAPNSEAKYRLGNESETYVEATFRYSFEDEQMALFESNLTLGFVSPTNKSNSFITTTSVREAYVKSQGIVKKKPLLTFWAGQRFYKLWDIHINDFWIRDMSGLGGGIEDLLLGESMMFSLAFLGGSIDELQSNGNVRPLNKFAFNKTTLDLNLYDINVGFGKLGLTVDLSVFTGDSLITFDGIYEVESSNGISFGVTHKMQIKDGINLFSIFYGTGAAENYTALMVQPIGVIPVPGEKMDVEAFKRFSIANDLRVDFNSSFSLLGLLLYQRLGNGQLTGNKTDWFSAGIRPSLHINRYLSIVGEFGFDYTSQKDYDKGTLIKMTIAPQISPLNKILSRPAIRAYFTYAHWSNSFVGSIAENSFPDQNKGISIGIQMETWW